ncbi:MAG: HIT family protein [Chloroflexota bacterium]
MPKIELTLTDTTTQQLAQLAAQYNMPLAELLSQGIERRWPELKPGVQNWMPRQQWDALVRGDNCPLCAEVTSSEAANAHGVTISDLGISRLRLAANQSVMGYCVLICRMHVRELYHLSAADRAQFVADLTRTGQALETVFQPVKMNFEMLGNAVPHLHCHIKPRYYGDPAPAAPIWPDQHPHWLSADEMAARVALIHAALEVGS